MSGIEETTDHASALRTVRCAKCGAENPRRSNVCEACGAHLHVTCHNCGHRNERALSRCAECGHHLHRSWTTRMSRGLFGKYPKLSLFQIALLILGILLGIGMIVFFSNYKPPEPESRYAPLFPAQLTRHA